LKIYDIFKNNKNKIKNEDFIFNSKRLLIQKNGVKIKMENHKNLQISIIILQTNGWLSTQTQKIRRCVENGY